jgi:2-polyprenyl-6-hydroxyphenyl methylase/3-demethylubiquinone-9 3-methyltransferase
MTDLTDLGSHFAFGENWANYAESLSEHEIDQAEEGLRRLLDAETLAGRSFLDIGCGSGVHSLAALRLGASQIVACDIDPMSVQTAQTVLQRFAIAKDRSRVFEMSVFALDAARVGTFDVVYSWGVLHHTGDMARAMAAASSLVAPDGLFVFALYRRTLLCPLWVFEKRWYASASPTQQRAMRRAYIAARALVERLRGRSLESYIANYRGNRGMSFEHDVHDWLGGYPYESISPDQVDAIMSASGLSLVRRQTDTRLLRRIGLLGTGCDEYVYRR